MVIYHCGNFLPRPPTHVYACVDTNLWVQVHTNSSLVMRSHVILLDFMVIAVRFLHDDDHLLTSYLVCFLPQPLVRKFHGASDFCLFRTLLTVCAQRSVCHNANVQKVLVKWENWWHTFNTRMEAYYYCCQKERSVNIYLFSTLPLFVRWSVRLFFLSGPKWLTRNVVLMALPGFWLHLPIRALPLEEILGWRIVSQGIIQEVWR